MPDIQPTSAELKAVDLASALEHSLRGSEINEVNVRNAIVSMASCFIGISEILKTNTGYLVNHMADELSEKDNDPHGNPWCVIFGQYVYKRVSRAYEKPDLLPYNTAGSQALAAYLEKKDIANTDYNKVAMGDGMIWTYPGGIHGHFEICATSNKTEYSSIGGNTNGEFSRDGGAVHAHMKVPWKKWGASTAEPTFSKHDDKKYLRCTVSVADLMRFAWA